MEENNEQMWAAEKRHYAAVATSLVNRPIKVMDAVDGLGYTQNGSIIYVAKDHPIYACLEPEDIKMFRFGITIHEDLHQIFTNFSYIEEIKLRLANEKYFLNLFDKEMYHTLINLIEDPAIENMAPQVVGGTALKALDFMIAKIGEVSGRFDEGCRYPFEELINALVQFGDLGILHGNFRFKSVRRIFLKISPLFYAAINEPDNRRRVDMVQPIHKICRPLWKQYSVKKQNALYEFLRRLLEQLHKQNQESAGIGVGQNGTVNMDSLKNRKRKITIKKVSKDQYTAAQKELEKNPQKDDGISDIEILVCDEAPLPDKSGNQNEKATIAGKTENTSSQLQSSEAGRKITKTAIEDTCKSDQNQDMRGNKSSPEGNNENSNTVNPSMRNPGSSAKSNSKNIQRKQSTSNISSPSNLQAKETENNSNHDASLNERELSEEESKLLEEDIIPKFSQADYDDILECFNKENEIIEAELEETKEYFSELPDLSEYFSEHPIFSSANVLNCYVQDVDAFASEKYDTIIGAMEGGIERVKSELKHIFSDDHVKRYYSDSGRIKLNRIASGKVTTKLFSRKTMPSEKANMCVGILGDNSASTSGIINQIILTIVTLAEIFGEFGIPLYCMGFQSKQDVDAKQTHYIRWENSRFERERVLSMKASGGNFDSYSIRYMSELLSQRCEKHKLLIVISDGDPSRYFARSEGIVQNTLAVTDAWNQRINVLGIGVGSGINVENFLTMYQKEYFIHVRNSQDLFDHISEKMIYIVDNWQ